MPSQVISKVGKVDLAEGSFNFPFEFQLAVFNIVFLSLCTLEKRRKSQEGPLDRALCLGRQSCSLKFVLYLVTSQAPATKATVCITAEVFFFTL